MHARLRGPNISLIIHQIINRTRFPSLADEIVEPRPYMNIKVAAFTVSEKSINTIWLNCEYALFSEMPRDLPWSHVRLCSAEP